jgi:hypothetical protein
MNERRRKKQKKNKRFFKAKEKSKDGKKESAI